MKKKKLSWQISFILIYYKPTTNKDNALQQMWNSRTQYPDLHLEDPKENKEDV